MIHQGKLFLASLLLGSAAAYTDGGGDGDNTGVDVFGGTYKGGGGDAPIVQNSGYADTNNNNENEELHTFQFRRQGNNGQNRRQGNNGQNRPRAKAEKVIKGVDNNGRDNGNVWNGDDNDLAASPAWKGDGWRKVTDDPTSDPTLGPSSDPTSDPTTAPVWKDDGWSTPRPTYRPTRRPTPHPTEWVGDDHDPTLNPTLSPTDWNGDDHHREVSWSGDDHDPTLHPTLSPTDWNGDDHHREVSWSGDDHDPTLSPTRNKCRSIERDTCCSQDSNRWSFNQQSEVCDMLGCNLKKCGKRSDLDSQWSGDSHDISNESTWSGDDHDIDVRASDWSGDDHDPTFSPTRDKCKSFERNLCCSQSDDYSWNDQTVFCDRLGCNLKKCAKRSDLDPDWSGDSHSSSTWSGDDHDPTASPVWKGDGWRKVTDDPTSDPTLEPSLNPTYNPTKRPTWKPSWRPTRRPTKRPTPNPTEWSGDSWETTKDIVLDKCSSHERGICCEQESRYVDRLYSERRDVCSMLGCNIKKCRSRSSSGEVDNGYGYGGDAKVSITSGDGYGGDVKGDDNHGDGYGGDYKGDDNGDGYGGDYKGDDNGDGYGGDYKGDDNGDGYGGDHSGSVPDVFGGLYGDSPLSGSYGGASIPDFRKAGGDPIPPVFDNSSHFESRVTEQCDEKRLDDTNPDVCVLVCTTLTKIMSGGVVLSEVENTVQRRCE